MNPVPQLQKAPRSFKVGLVLAAHAALWLSISFLFDIHPDMADHWVWSRYLTWGYFEHPPVVAFLMRLATFGVPPVLGLKLGSVLFSVLILWVAFLVARSMVGAQAAWWFLLALEATPYFTLGSTFWHIDQPYMLCWLAGLWVLFQLILSENPRWMLLLGLVLGLGAESKYIMALLPLSFGVFMLLNRRWLFLLKSPYTYGGAFICLLVLAPNLYWNATHHWVTFSYNFKKGLTGGDPFRHFFLFTSGHLLLFSLLLAPLLWFLLARDARTCLKKEPPLLNQGWNPEVFSMLLWSALVPLLFFTLASFKGRGADPHWVNVSYFGLLLILAAYWSKKPKPFKLLAVAVGFNYLLVLAGLFILYTNFFGVDYLGTKLAKTLGWVETSQAIQTVLAQQQRQTPPFVISREYNLSGALSLYLPSHPWPHSLEKPIRNQWSPVVQVIKQGALVVCPLAECPEVLEQVKKRFGQLPEYLSTLTTKHQGFVVRQLALFILPGDQR